MKKINSIIIIVLSAWLVSCDRDEVFEKEQYKNVFSLISGTNNIYEKFHDMSEPESVGYLSVSCGGTNRINKDIVINLLEDESLIDNYNKANFDVEYAKYALKMPERMYDIEQLKITVPAGEIKASVPVRIRPEGLSPDSVYFIPVRVDSYDNYETNAEKSYVLYRVKTKNAWAKSDGSSTYNIRGSQLVSGSISGIEIFGTKIMHPLTGNKVRIMAGTEEYKADLEVFKKSAIVLEVDSENKVHISSYKNMEVTQVDGDPDFPNTFVIEDDGFKTYKMFLLCYNYKSSDGNMIEMKEELRLGFNPENDE
jgi:hypothetical protein